MGKFFRLFKIFKKKEKSNDVFLIQKDIKNIDEILYKKEKYLKKIDHLDQRIILIQKSTQTTIPQLRSLHDTLRQRYKWYYNWHLQPYAKSVHILFFIFYVFALGFTLNYLIKPITRINAQTTYSFPRWEWANPKPTGNDLKKVTTCSDGTVWAVGSGGTILKSTDNGETYSQEYTGTSSSLDDIVCHGPSNVIAVGSAGQILQYNGYSWTNRAIGLTANHLSSVTVSSTGQFAAVGEGGTILYSANGIDWSVKGAGLTTEWLDSVTVSSTGQFVAVGAGGTILYSTNGIDWSVKGAGLTTNQLNGVTVSSTGQFVAVDASGTILYSTNGIDWSIKGAGLTTRFLFSIISSSTGQFVAVGASGTILYSANGTDWSVKGVGLTIRSLYGVTVSSTGQFVAVGAGGTILYSTNGIDWSVKGVGLTYQLIFSIAVSSTGQFVAVGAGGTILYSANGIDWSIEGAGLTTAWLYGVTVSPTGQFVAVGAGGTILYSANGIDWSIEGAGLTTNYISSVTVSSTGQFVTVGDAGTILYSANGIDWSIEGVDVTDQQLLSITVSPTGQFVAVGAGGTILYSANGIDWSIQGAGLTSQSLSKVTVSSTGQFVAVGEAGTILYSADGQDWSKKGVGLTAKFLTNVTVSSDGQFVAVGDTGVILRYFYPANATATKLLVALPGQDFADQSPTTPISGVPTSVRAGENVPIYAYAVDNSNMLDRGIKYQVRISSTDSQASNTAEFNLDNNLDEACDSGSTERIENPCGIGSANYVFHAPGNFTVYSQDTGGSGLTQGVSTTTIHVDPGPASSSAFENFPTSLSAGTPSGAITLQAKDLYGNNTTVSSDTTVNLTTNSSRGRFSTNRSTWVSGEINLTIPAGSGSITFYYLDLATGNPTITATINGLASASAQINVTTGELSGSSLTLSRNSIRAGESLTAQVNLKNSQGVILSDKTVRLVSSREGDNTGGDQVTDGSGNASFNVSATKVGSFDLIIYNASDDLYATVQKTVQVTPGDLSSAVLSSNISKITAGESINLTTTLFDRFGNTLDSSNSLISFLSSDSQTEFKEKNHWFSDSGSYSQDVTLKTAGTQTISALKSDATLGSVKVDVNPASADASVSDISSDKDRIDPGDGVAAIVVKLMDAYGNGVLGKNVSITSSRLEDKIKPLSVTTGDDGNASFSFTSDIQGESTIVAQDVTDSLILNKKLKIRVMPPNILDKIKESPVVKALTNFLAPVSKALALIGLIPLILQILQAIPSAAPLASSVFPALFTTASVRRRKKPWGNVFDSVTGHPVDLAVVRLYAKDTGKLVSTQVTDFDGRFHFLAGTGTYYIQVKRKGYEFPAKISKFKASQLSSRFGKDSDIYLGVPFTIKTQNAQINLNIPIDPVLEKLTNNIKFKKSVKEIFEWFLIGISYIAFPLMFIGAAIAILSTVVIPSRINFVTDVVYFFLLLGFLVTSRIRQNRLGQVFDSENKKPIIGATVTVFDQEYNAIRQTQTTDRNGNFSILAQKGAYYIIIEKDGYKFPSTKIESTKKQPVYTGGIINKAKPGFIGVDVPIDKQ